MYEVTTATKTLLTTTDKLSALVTAQALSSKYSYVEVKEIVTTSPWYARSIRIFSK